MENLELIQLILDWSMLLVRLAMHDFNRYTRASGLSLSQMIVLLHLYYKGPGEVLALGDLLQMSPAGASQMVERLVQQEFVQREESPDDRRVRVVRLTDRGRQAVQESMTMRRQWTESLVSALAEEQKGIVASALRALIDQARQLEARGE